jgi:hypothetical protein
MPTELTLARWALKAIKEKLNESCPNHPQDCGCRDQLTDEIKGLIHDYFNQEDRSYP